MHLQDNGWPNGVVWYCRLGAVHIAPSIVRTPYTEQAKNKTKKSPTGNDFTDFMWTRMTAFIFIYWPDSQGFYSAGNDAPQLKGEPSFSGELLFLRLFGKFHCQCNKASHPRTGALVVSSPLLLLSWLLFSFCPTLLFLKKKKREGGAMDWLQTSVEKRKTKEAPTKLLIKLPIQS